ncbi:M23 family metallopeptidase [Microbacterium oryzae]|uniref:M23 family metallopeptidase n=1 Tax=Microbacterium oryzae TaxID=743009 RepID=UPI0025B0B6A2|nr:M23 family metallopeptidase [Microbacterium oryzae]MDN3310850.1 M23 family metallopeptidase [Microbacterium oryzae]
MSSVAIDLAFPFEGRWLVQNSPANRVPGHGTRRFATAHAIDFVPVVGARRTAPFTIASLLHPEPPDSFPGFGRTILAPLDGTVVSAFDDQPDHAARRGVPSIAYALTQARRAAAGWLALAGNHVLIESGGIVVALCHLQQGSVRALPGQRVSLGDVLARCGNSGNSTEPHVHVQAMAGPDAEVAEAVPITFRGSLPRNGETVQGEDVQGEDGDESPR